MSDVDVTQLGPVERFANPYLRCSVCGGQVEGYFIREFTNAPCRHVGMRDLCPSWGPVDGCRCARMGLPHHEGMPA